MAQQLDDAGTQVLSAPVYLLVPSHSLRNHLLERLAGYRPAYVGLGCLTLRSLARDVLERCGESPLPGSWMLPLLVRRAARQHPSLRSCLDHLHDGYSSLIASVTDLLEAGLDPAHADAIDEVLAEEGRLVASVANVQRSRSLIKVAIQVQEQLHESGLGHVSSLLQRATELLRTRSDLELRSSGFHVYGFADATGVATDLIEAVLLRFGGTVYLDRPPDPTAPETEDPAFEFSRRFATRLADLGQPDLEPVVTTDPAEIQLITALGARAEVRDVGWRIRHLLDDGVAPERIGVVARRLDSYRSPLRTHFGRLGIPHSAERTAGPLLPKGRRIRALLEMVTRRERARLDRWLDARLTDSSTVADFDLRLAMFGLGASRLEELASVTSEEVLRQEFYPLPVRLGYSNDEDDSEIRLARRRVPTVEIRRARDQATELCGLFDTWKGRHSWEVHLEKLSRLTSALGWATAGAVMADVQKALDRLSLGIPVGLELDLDEFTQTLNGALTGIGLDPLGGVGGGVQILDVTEARGRTFEHLFVLGMNRGVFPRNVREDPSFPDSLRQVLGRQGHGVLPDLPLKRAGFAEERFLFAQLCSASSHVSLSWQVADDDNHEVSTSPLVERLLWTRESIQVSSPRAVDPAEEPADRPRTELESAIRAALVGSSRQLKAAMTQAQPTDLSVTPRDLTTARLGVVAELDRTAGPTPRLGPYFGYVGAARDPLEPRLAQDLYVTTLERFAVCPWRTFLERLLRLETLPDPVEILPGLDPFLVGQLVHRVLEQIAKEHLPDSPPSIDEARQTPTVDIPWPEPDSLWRIVRREAFTVAQRQGITWEGFADVLARVTLPYLDQAHSLLETNPDEVGPVAVETDLSLSLGSGTPGSPLHFKVDRIDHASGRLVLSDYKTSRRGISDAKTQKTRDKHLVAEIRKGRLLQAAAYARAAAGPDDQGRYVFLHPDFRNADEGRIVPVATANQAALAAFDSTTATLIEAWHQGVFFPRLVEPDADREPRTCEFCGVAEACLRGDSGLRGRLRDWAATHPAVTDVDKAFLAAWNLPSTKGPQS